MSDAIPERSFSQDARQMLFLALIAAIEAGEAEVCSVRIAEAAMRSLATDAPDDLSTRLTDEGIEFGSREHLDSVRPLPIAASAQETLRRLSANGETTPVTTAEILNELQRTDPRVAAWLAAVTRQ
jgi:hypothetical protein